MRISSIILFLLRPNLSRRLRQEVVRGQQVPLESASSRHSRAGPCFHQLLLVLAATPSRRNRRTSLRCGCRAACGATWKRVSQPRRRGGPIVGTPVRCGFNSRHPPRRPRRGCAPDDGASRRIHVRSGVERTEPELHHLLLGLAARSCVVRANAASAFGSRTLAAARGPGEHPDRRCDERGLPRHRFGRSRPRALVLHLPLHQPEVGIVRQGRHRHPGQRVGPAVEADLASRLPEYCRRPSVACSISCVARAARPIWAFKVERFWTAHSECSAVSRRNAEQDRVADVGVPLWGGAAARLHRLSVSGAVSSPQQPCPGWPRWPACGLLGLQRRRMIAEPPARQRRGQPRQQREGGLGDPPSERGRRKAAPPSPGVRRAPRLAGRHHRKPPPGACRSVRPRNHSCAARCPGFKADTRRQAARSSSSLRAHRAASASPLPRPLVPRILHRETDLTAACSCRVGAMPIRSSRAGGRWDSRKRPNQRLALALPHVVRTSRRRRVRPRPGLPPRRPHTRRKRSTAWRRRAAERRAHPPSAYPTRDRTSARGCARAGATSSPRMFHQGRSAQQGDGRLREVRVGGHRAREQAVRRRRPPDRRSGLCKRSWRSGERGCRASARAVPTTTARRSPSAAACLAAPRRAPMGRAACAPRRRRQRRHRQRRRSTAAVLPAAAERHVGHLSPPTQPAHRARSRPTMRTGRRAPRPRRPPPTPAIATGSQTGESAPVVVPATSDTTRPRAVLRREDVP